MAAPHDSRSDNELMAAIVERDRAAFRALYDRHSRLVYGLLRRITRSEADAEDLLQDVFLQAWSRAAQFDPGRGTPVAWLVLMARSRGLDQLRRRGRRREVGGDDATTQHEDLVTRDAVAHNLEQDELQERATAAIDQLPADQQQAIRWAFLDGLSHSEIARRHDLPLGTVKTRIRTGLERLRKLVMEQGIGAGNER